MNEFLKMDIFFVIAAVFGLVLSVLLIILFVYLIKFIKNLKHISDKVRTETDSITEDIQTLRKNIRTEGFKVRHALSFFGSIINKRKKGK